MLGLIGSGFALVQDLPASAIVGIGGGWLAGVWALFGFKERWQALRTKSPRVIKIVHADMEWASRDGHYQYADGPFCPRDHTRLIHRDASGNLAQFPERNWLINDSDESTYLQCPACSRKYKPEGRNTDFGEIQLEANHLIEAEAARLGL